MEMDKGEDFRGKVNNFMLNVSIILIYLVERVIDVVNLTYNHEKTTNKYIHTLLGFIS